MPRRRLVLPLALLALSGCSLVPEYETPSVAEPSGYKADEQPMLQTAALPAAELSDSWWTAFGSGEITALVETARANNRDLQAAMRRIDQARAQVKGAAASLYPTLDASGSAGRSGQWQLPSSESFRGALAVGYELDLWGANAAGVQAAEAGLASTQYDVVALDLVLQGDVIVTYLQALALADRLTVAENNLRLARNVLALVEEQFAAGAVSGLELAQQRQQVAAITSTLPVLEGQRRQTENALAVLLGVAPAQLPPLDGELDGVALPRIGAGLPATLLERRPDVLSAEAQLIAANANIGVAKAAFYPQIQLTAEGGIVSAALTAFLKPESLLYSLAASLVAPIFDGGAREADLEFNQAVYAELVELYRQSALVAYREVEDALVAQQSAELQEAALIVVAAQAQQAYDLAALQYSEGAIDLLNLLDAQRSLLDSQDALVQARLSRLTAVVDLAKALGGGWQGPAAGV